MMDKLLQRTSAAARQVMRQVRKLPRSQQVSALDSALRQFDSALPGKVRQVASRLRAQGASIEQAVERALALSLADASVTKIKNIGRSYQDGRLIPLGALGQADDEKSGPGHTIGKMFQGIVCSNDLQSSVTGLVGRKEGAQAQQATDVGYEVAQGFSQCQPAAPTPAPPAAPVESSGSWTVPVMLGVGAILVVGGAVWYTRRSKA